MFRPQLNVTAEYFSYKPVRELSKCSQLPDSQTVLVRSPPLPREEEGVEASELGPSEIQASVHKRLTDRPVD